MNTHRNNSLDTLRGIACILVILIHYPFPGTWGAIIKSICRTAIPFFFMLSGYYSNKNDESRTRIEIVKRIHKTIYICAGAIVFSLIMEYIFFFRGQSVHVFIEKYFNVSAILKLMLWNDTGDITHLWFLFALIYCYVFVYVICLFNTSPNGYRMVDITAFLIWVILIIFSEILPFSGHVIDAFYYRNSYLMGFPFFWLGFRLKTQCFVKTIDFRFAFFSGIIITSIERLFIGNIETSLGISFLSVVTFIKAVNNPVQGESNVLAVLGREYSLLIYILHWYVIYVEVKIINELSFLNSNWYLNISPLFVIFYSIAISIVMKKVYLLVKGLFHIC